MVHRGRYTAAIDGDFVVMLIGMRANRPWKPHKWLPVLVAMLRMLRSLRGRPHAGLLGWSLAWINGPAVVQYWRGYEQLDRFARADDDPHLPAWRWYNRALRSSGDVGIWHETYKVCAGEYESIYVNMPRIGLASVADHVPVGAAAGRIGSSDAGEPFEP